MKIKFSKKTICIIALLSFISFSSCEALDELDDSVDETLDEMLGISALSEDLNKTSSNYNVISDIVVNNKLVSSSEIKTTLPSSVPVSFTKKRYTLSGSVWSISSSSYSGTVPRSMFNKSSNVVKIVTQNNAPTVYINNASVNLGSGSGGSGTGGTGGTGTTETKLVEKDVEGKTYELKTFSFTVPSGVKTMVVKTTEPTGAHRNMADLFVRKGSAPIVAGPKAPSYLPKYSWTADYNSIAPNRESDVCTINNPQSGTWYVGLYGYNDSFNSRVTITIKK